jgi:hypothetical protein
MVIVGDSIFGLCRSLRLAVAFSPYLLLEERIKRGIKRGSRVGCRDRSFLGQVLHCCTRPRYPLCPGPIMGPAASLSIAPTAYCAWPLYSGAMRIDRFLIGLGVLILLVWAVFTAIDWFG